MRKFLVRVVGKNFRVLVQERKWFFGKKSCWRQVDFLTTIFIETESANSAIKQVTDALMTELEKEDRTTNDSIIELEEVRVDDKAYDLYAPGSGFTFFFKD